ncbi:MAG: GntR family transcriptional regulator [Alphaproteobacteria bacterium]
MRDKEKTSLRLLALQQFKDKLENQSLLPGQFISQRELAQTLGFSLGAIREAIPMLEAHGLILTIPQRGLQVFKPDINFIHNAFQLRLFLEQEALSAFMDNPNLHYIQQIKSKLETLLKAKEKAILTPEDIHEAQEIDFSFHFALIESLNNSLIQEIYNLNLLKIRLSALKETAITDQIFQDVVQAHIYLFSLILKRDKKSALKALKKHLSDGKNRALGLDVSSL